MEKISLKNNKFSEENSRRLGEKLCRPVYYFYEIDSTNTFVRENNLKDKSLVIADAQTSGRGRRGNSFSSPDSGIYFSYVMKNPENDDELLTVKAGLAVCMAIEEIIPLLSERNKEKTIKPAVKWVNDIYIGEKKLSGILCERTGDEVIIGIGINLFAGKLEGELRNTCTGLLEEYHSNKPVSAVKEQLIGLIVRNIERGISGEDVLNAYESRSFLTGREISFIHDGERKTGLVTGINDKCNLIVRTEEGVLVLSSGEVHTIRKS